jgi:acyl carrier protein
MNELSTIVSRNVTTLLDRPALNVQAIDLDADLLSHYGLTSLNMVMLLTLVCEEAKIDLTRITEDDLSRLHTAQDIVTLMQSIRMHGAAAS